MVASSAVLSTPAAAPTTAAAPGKAAADGGQQTFAGLIATAADDHTPLPADAGADDTATETDTAPDEPAEPGAAQPSLLSWLFGVMATSGRAAPDAMSAADAPATPGAEPATLAQVAGAVNAASAALVDGSSPGAGLEGAPLPALADAGIDGEQRRAGADDSGNGTAETLVVPDLEAKVVADGSQPADARPLEFSRSAHAEAAILHAAAAQAAAAAMRDAPLPPSAVAQGTAGLAPPPGALSALVPTFVDDLGERIEWQMADGVSEARIELHPAELGSLTVRIETHGDQARVHIVAAEAATRVLLTQAMPQLRDMLTSSGLNLARSHVEAGSRGASRGTSREDASRDGMIARRRVTHVLLVDTYA